MKFLAPVLMGMLASGFTAIEPAAAQGVDTIVVFDGSGSMWGQIDGLTKIEIARETLSTVLSEMPGAARIGMIAYGHREKGVCSDIETIVPVGPANATVPAMIAAANGMQPKGKTPLTDAVRIAAQELRYTENAATVILVTDGIETCNADPCALANELERGGIGFTAHVVGFDLTQDEGAQVQCLADNTGGLYLSANNADELGNALRRSVQAEVIAPDEDDFGPAETVIRNVTFIFRDTPDGPQIGIRELSGSLEHTDGMAIASDVFSFAYPEASGASATATLEPGRYVAVLQRGDTYTTRYEFDVPEGEGEHVIEASLSGALTINMFINPNMPYLKGDPFPHAVGGSGPRINLNIFQVINGQKAETPIAKANMDKLTLPLGPGWYLVQGNLDRTTSAEQLVEVTSGAPTVIDFSFDATRVFVDARDTNGDPVKKQTAFWYDKVPSGRNYWTGGGGNTEVPFYLPSGQWVLNAGNSGGGERRSQRVVEVSGDYSDIRIAVGEGETLDPDTAGFMSSPAYTGCLEFLKVEHTGCLVKREDLSVTLAAAPVLDDLPEQDIDPVVTQNDQGNPLQGVIGTAHVFVDRSGDPLAYVIEAPGNTGMATIMLSQGWCGDASCSAATIPVEHAAVEAIFNDQVSSTTFDTESHGFLINSYGQNKHIVVTGDRGDTRLDYFDKVVLDSGDIDGGGGQAPAGGGDMFGVFSLYDTGGTLDEITTDYLHVQNCQRSPLVLYPDGTISTKRFTPPTSATDDPFKTVFEGQCEVSGRRYECAGPNGENLNFEARPLGDNHFMMIKDGKEKASIAASCFFPGGELDANAVMPNGRTIADLITERDDGAAAGFTYGQDNVVALK